jgi:thiamine biosynthesis lipoprotein
MDTCNGIRRARPLLGTFVEIAAADAARPAMESAIEAAFAAVAKVHRLMSFHDPDSDVSRVNRDAGTRAVAVHPWTYHVIETALDLHRGSGGAFDIAVAPVLQNFGMLPRTGNDTQPIVAAGSTADVIELLPGHRVRLRKRDAAIDLGGIAKGFAVDRAIAVLRDSGVARGVVNAGGDLAAFGRLPETVHIRDPRDPSRPLCHVEIADAALASSGRCLDPLQSNGTQSTAVIDPRAQAPVRAIAGASVLAPSCMIADALTKVVMIAGETATDLLTRHKASALAVLKSGDIRVTPDWHHAVRLAA